ncbi:hypothetical protein HYV57_02460 [Candidatus Peregrinibacteria bacterium]|nr:hypothetical protein [Candidatus Peregrinibacteria bacterium]
MEKIVLSLLSDSELYQKCKIYGLNSKQWTRKFAGILPEVLRRRLHRRRGFSSIHEFAAKLAGMNQSTVNRILQLASKIENKPRLREQFEQGLQSWSKLEKVAYIATPEDEGKWAKRVEIMPQAALELYVQEMRKENNEIEKNKTIQLDTNVLQLSTLAVQNYRWESPPQGTFAPEKKYEKNNILGNIQNEYTAENSTISYENFYENSHEKRTLSFPVSQEAEFQIRLFQQKLEKKSGEKMSLGEVLERLLKNSVCQKCLKSIDETTTIIQKMNNSEKKNPASSRYLPMSLKRSILERTQGHCVFPGCLRPAEIFHHTKRFALQKEHNPDSIQPLCKIHERLAHTGLIQNEELSADKWKIFKEPDTLLLKYRIDQKVNSYRI